MKIKFKKIKTKEQASYNFMLKNEIEKAIHLLSKLACHAYITAHFSKLNHHTNKIRLSSVYNYDKKDGKTKKKSHLPAPTSPSKMKSFSLIAIKETQ